MKSSVLVVIYTQSQIRSFIDTKSFRKIAQQKKYNLEFLYSKKLIKYLPNENSNLSAMPTIPIFAEKLGYVLCASNLWQKRYKSSAHLMRAIRTHGTRKQRLAETYVIDIPQISNSKIFRTLVKLFSYAPLYKICYTIRREYLNRFFEKSFYNSSINLKNFTSAIVPFSGLLSPEFDDYINFFNSKKITSIAIQDNWDNLSSKTFISSKPDIFCVWGEQSAGHLRYIHSLYDTKVKITGSPRMIPYYSTAPRHSSYQTIPKELRKRIKSPYILFMGTGIDDFSILKEIINSVSTLKKIQIVYRPHPNSRNSIDSREIKELLKYGLIIDDSTNSRYVYYHCGLVMNSELIVTQFSTTMVEGLLCNKKILLTGFTVRKIKHSWSDTINTWAHFIGIAAFPNVFVSNQKKSFKKDLLKALFAEKQNSDKCSSWLAAKLNPEEEFYRVLRSVN
jgi:hypothetical protein